MELSPAGRPDAWFGAAEWTEDGGWWQAWRLPRRTLARCGSPLLTTRATIPNGCRVAVRTDAAALEVEFANDPDGVDGFVDVVVDEAVIETAIVPGGRSRLRVEIAPGVHRLELWLPHDALVRFSPVRLLDATHADAVPAAPSFVAYGSSLTLSGASPGPARTWPASVARESTWDLTGLGMPGECHLDPAIARHIAAIRADLVFVCPGVNVHGSSSFTERTLVPALTGFLDAVRDGHPDTPIVLMTPIDLAAYEQVGNLVGLTLARVRELVEVSARILIDDGDERLTILDGRTILGADEQHLLSDGVHPFAAGYELMARRLGPVLRAALAGAGAASVAAT